ncbi:ABC transporter ATP-binding protein [Marinomonas sp. TW1]|uniref:ABC transporter ATP-binding protein n=1 Tax=Marinomonas sp. TW1 TaxID=1561203 RepID=UPI0007AFD9AE|nr:ABC transporter ATP-binding protein [Marinomonas sp. TW1]KZN15374.1 ABC transporter [Marinomonas sp. TW1]
MSKRVHSNIRLAGDDLSVAYGDRVILKQVNFQVPPNQVTVLIGPNGSGKSTLLKTLSRILTPKTGCVLLDGHDIHKSHTRDVAKKLAVLPQGPVAPEGLTVKELVSQGRFSHQSLFRQWSTEDEGAVQAAMDVTQVSEFANRLADDLSGGQRQRCWIAMVLAQETDLILLDEPTTYLDLKVQVDLMNLLVHLAHDLQRTLVVVLHELNLAAAYADYLVMMRDGEICQHGKPNDVFTSENLKSVFDLDARVVQEPISKQLICIPNYPSSLHPNFHTEYQPNEE